MTSEEIYLSDYKKILETMHTNMSSAPQTGDPTLDFLYEMAPHHQGAVEMSENVLKYPIHEKVLNLAKTIIPEQNMGIQKIHQFIEQIKDTPKVLTADDTEYLQKFETILHTMIQKMQSVEATGNISLDFLNQMMPHHEGAIEMFKNILNYTSNTEVKKMCQQSLTTQEKQYVEMSVLVGSLS